MLNVIRRSPLATIVGLLALFALVVTPCPCAPGSMAAASPGEHSCCASEPGLHAAVPSCCVDHGAASAPMSPPAPAPSLAAAAPVARVTPAAIDLRSPASSSSPTAAERPPLILRV